MQPLGLRDLEVGLEQHAFLCAHYHDAPAHVHDESSLTASAQRDARLTSPDPRRNEADDTPHFSAWAIVRHSLAERGIADFVERPAVELGVKVSEMEGCAASLCRRRCVRPPFAITPHAGPAPVHARARCAPREVAW
eukprot:1205349-Prymnesium_polylepis.1